MCSCVGLGFREWVPIRNIIGGAAGAHIPMTLGLPLSACVPLEVRNLKPATGEQRAYCSGPLLCLKFRDKKDIFMLSSQHSGFMEDACRSRGRPSVAHVRSKPGSIIEYNRNMGSVD